MAERESLMFSRSQRYAWDSATKKQISGSATLLTQTQALVRHLGNYRWPAKTDINRSNAWSRMYWELVWIADSCASVSDTRQWYGFERRWGTGSPISMCHNKEKIFLKNNKILPLPCSLCCFVSPVLIWGGSSESFGWRHLISRTTRSICPKLAQERQNNTRNKVKQVFYYFRGKSFFTVITHRDWATCGWGNGNTYALSFNGHSPQYSSGWGSTEGTFPSLITAVLSHSFGISPSGVGSLWPDIQTFPASTQGVCGARNVWNQATLSHTSIQSLHKGPRRGSIWVTWSIFFFLRGALISFMNVLIRDNKTLTKHDLSKIPCISSHLKESNFEISPAKHAP